MPDMVMANCASKLTDQLAGPKDLWSNVHSWSLVSEVGTYCLGVTMGNALSYLCVLGGWGSTQPVEEIPLTWIHALWASGPCPDSCCCCWLGCCLLWDPHG